jgi:hypothetical protein
MVKLYSSKAVMSFICRIVMILVISFSTASFKNLSAETGPGIVNVTIPTGGFHIDGNLHANLPTAGIGDWVSRSGGGGGFVLDNNGVPIDPSSTSHIYDLYSSNSDNVFSGGMKINDNPNSWRWKYGNVPQKDDMNNGLIHFASDASGKKWVMISADRLSNSGDSYMDFEFLQAQLTKTTNPSNTGGGFSTPAPSSTGGRTVGDFLLSVHFAGPGTITFDVLFWEKVGSTYKYVSHISSIPSGTIYASTNSTSIASPYKVFGTYAYSAKKFVEAAINLSDLIGSVYPCSTTKLSSIIIKTKSSHSSCATLKDFFDPVPVNILIGNAFAGEDQTKCDEGGQATFTLSGIAVPGPGYTTTSSLWSVVSYTGSRSPVILNPDRLNTNVIVYSGHATIRLTVTNTKCHNICSASDDVVLHVLPPATVNSMDNISVCNKTPQDPIIFSSPASGVVFNWTSTQNIGFGTSGTGNIPGYTASTPGVTPQTATVAVTATQNGCTGPAMTFTITVNPAPEITFEPVPEVCSGAPAVTLSASPAGGIFTGPYVTGNLFTPLTPGTYNITYSLTTAATGCPSAPVTKPITVKACLPVWSGLVDTDWYKPGNWVGDNVPSSGDNVIIPPGCPNYPDLGSGILVTCNDLDIQSGGSVIVSGGGALTVNGDLNNNGDLTIESGGSLITSCNVTGTATIQREITSDLSWHLLSSPVMNQQICNGVFAPLATDFPGDINTWDFYNWMPNCPTPPYPAEHWRNLRTSSGTMNYTDFGTPPLFEVAKGYLVAYGQGWSPVKSFVGVPNTCDKTLSFAEIQTACSWELAGNPFPSAVAWDNVTGKQNLVTDYYYVWNENKAGGAGYEYWKDTNHKSSSMINGNIPPMQGFFVKVDPNGGKTLGFPNSSRVHDVLTDMWLKDVPEYKLSVKLSDASHYDETFIMFENSSNRGRDRSDAEKILTMDNAVPQIYSLIESDQKTAFNSLPFVSEGITTPLGIVAPAEGNYTITVRGLDSFGSIEGLTLEDRKLGYSQDILQNAVYSFTAEGNEDAGRFFLHFKGKIGDGSPDKSAVNIYSSGKTIYITCAAGFINTWVTVYNLLGQEILTHELANQTADKISLNATNSYYIVKVKNDSMVKTVKVYIN